ncbi:hypothetical protein L596_023519 [Steinernema carpocapsae]|uniref:F-box domain-containing protein n=1 Tax=Steinernema carpocapsae TaxID=34508 RepID=A0A4V5ZZF6_STECR|nr:hypothetical protein L596_023519 [Steinernema carpocapsae]
MSLTLERFPNEVLLQIFEKCDLETLLEVRKVCERFNEIASKVLRDRQLFKVHLEMKNVNFGLYTASVGPHPSSMTVEEISREDFQSFAYREILFAFYEEHVRSEDFDLGDYLSEIMMIDSMHIKGPARDKRYADAAKILDCIHPNCVPTIYVTLGALRFSANEFKLVKAMEHKVSKKLTFWWSNASRIRSNISREIDACLDMFRSNRGALKHVNIKGHFSVAEMVECFNHVEYGVFWLSQIALRKAISTPFLIWSRVWQHIHERSILLFGL